MAKSVTVNGFYQKKPKVKRKGVHAKTRHSKLKGSKNYVKKSRGQG